VTASAETSAPTRAELHDDIIYPAAIPFLLVHLACFAAIWTGVTWKAVWLGVALYVLRMFAVTAGFHRYFSHRSFKTGRVMQFLFAFVGEMSAQRGVLWWASKHRHHHKYSDMPEDVHSPRQAGFFYSHVGWIFARRHDHTDLSAIQDFARFPELRWLEKHNYVPALVLAILAYVIAGWPGLVVGFVWSTVVLYHGTFMINSLAHVHGKRRYLTGDDSRNNPLLAIITLGEGWHNNHHAYMSSTRQGFRWWEFDPTFYALKAFSWLGLVWDLRAPPRAMVKGGYTPQRSVIEKVARQLAEHFPIERLAAEARASLGQHMDEVVRRARESREQAEAFVREMHLPELPTRDEIRARAQAMFHRSPSLDQAIERARELIVQAVCAKLCEPALQSPA